MNKQKKRTNLFSTIPKVFSFLLLLRWGLWLAAHLPMSGKALDTLLHWPPLQSAAAHLSSGPPGAAWKFLTMTVLGFPGIAVWCLATLGSVLVKQCATKGLPSLSQLWYRSIHPTRPVVYHTVRRCYLRIVHNGAESIADLSRDKQVSFPGTTLTVRLVKDEAQLFDSDMYITSLPPEQWFHSKDLGFEFVPFRLQLPEYR